ncbi:MAG TPA: histidine kinase [Acidimicrobiales bacterium]|nr:histidine kinase [Acidimicrobiales bacterium]
MKATHERAAVGGPGGPDGAGVDGVPDAAAVDAVRASRARIVAASNLARRTIERRLHDGPQQHLVAVAVKLLLAEQAVDADPEEARRILTEARADVQATVQQLRDLAYLIHPPLLADHGLTQALRTTAGRAPVDVELTVAGDPDRRYPPEIEAALYFCCLDAIHAATGPISLWVGEGDGALVFEVAGPLVEGPGLTNVADRTDTLGGSVTVEPDGAGGLHVVGRFPLG